MRMKYLSVALAVGLIGCSSDTPTKISERFNLCAQFPAGSTYAPTTPGPDYDLGNLRLNNEDVEIYVGYQPDFPQRVAGTISRISGEFKFADIEVSGTTEKLLLWRKRSAREGALLVVFKGQNLLTALPSLKQEGIVADCQ